MTDESDDTARRTGRRRTGRRAVLAAGASAGLAATAGCLGLGMFGDDTDGSDDGGSETTPKGSLGTGDFRGSGPLVEGRPAPGGTSIEEMPELKGKLNVYIGGGEGGLYRTLIKLLEKEYSEFEPQLQSAPSSDLASKIVQKGTDSPADVFWAVDAGSLGFVAKNGAAATLPSKARDPVPKAYRTKRWVGVAGRARAVPYNTDALSKRDIPKKVREFPKTGTLNGAMGWAPTYSAFQAFVTAMRLLRGRSATKSWLNAMQDSGVSRYPDEFQVSNAVAQGEIKAGFANHYYAMRVKAIREDAPIDLAFTNNDAGGLVNVSGTQIIKGTDRKDLAGNFIRHLLSAEAQEFFATRTYAYPMIPEVEPVGGLPTIDELSPPDISFRKLSNIEPTLDLMREAGVL